MSATPVKEKSLNQAIGSPSLEGEAGLRPRSGRTPDDAHPRGRHAGRARRVPEGLAGPCTLRRRWARIQWARPHRTSAPVGLHDPQWCTADDDGRTDTRRRRSLGGFPHSRCSPLADIDKEMIFFTTDIGSWASVRHAFERVAEWAGCDASSISSISTSSRSGCTQSSRSGSWVCCTDRWHLDRWRLRVPLGCVLHRRRLAARRRVVRHRRRRGAVAEEAHRALAGAFPPAW